MTPKHLTILRDAQSAGEFTMSRNDFMRACKAAGAAVNNHTGSLHITFGEHNLRLGRGLIVAQEDTMTRFAIRKLATDLLAQQNLG